MKVIDFLDDFLKTHRGRYVPHDWPENGTEEWIQYRRLWLSAFIERRVTKNEADTASVRCGSNPPRFRNDHLPRILNEIEAFRLANQILNVPDDRQGAADQSKYCQHCGGSGLRIVYHPRYDGCAVVTRNFKAGAVKEPGHVAATCMCAMGLWIRNNIDDDVRKRMPENEKILNGQSAWLYDDPTSSPDDPDVTCPRDIVNNYYGVITHVDSSDISRDGAFLSNP